MPTLATLRDNEDLEEYFALLDAGEPIEVVLFEALRGGDPLDLAFARALLVEALGVTLASDTEISWQTIAEILDPTQGFPSAEARYRAALLFLLLDGDPVANQWRAIYCIDCESRGFHELISELQLTQRFRRARQRAA